MLVSWPSASARADVLPKLTVAARTSLSPFCDSAAVQHECTFNAIPGSAHKTHVGT